MKETVSHSIPTFQRAKPVNTSVSQDQNIYQKNIWCKQLTQTLWRRAKNTQNVPQKLDDSNKQLNIFIIILEIKEAVPHNFLLGSIRYNSFQ